MARSMEEMLREHALFDEARRQGRVTQYTGYEVINGVRGLATAGQTQEPALEQPAEPCGADPAGHARAGEG